VTLRREGDHLRGAGAGTVTVRNGAACGFTAELPFEHALPPATCGRLRVSVRPRRVRLAETTRVRVRVTREVGSARLPVEGARVTLGGTSTQTDADGRATLRYRPRGGPGVRRVRVRASGLGTARQPFRVLRG
jgi:hypothetical protein